MSRSGKYYTREKKEQRIALEKRKKNPVRLFVRSWDFFWKTCLSIFVFAPFIYTFRKNIYNIVTLYACCCLPLFPFAKKCSDDILRYYFSEKTFDEIINAGGARGLWVLYLVVIIPLTIPLAMVYFIYHYKKHKNRS